jgi:hypothetical protein
LVDHPRTTGDRGIRCDRRGALARDTLVALAFRLSLRERPAVKPVSAPS